MTLTPSLVILTETVRIKCALERILPPNKQILGLSALDADGFCQNDKAWTLEIGEVDLCTYAAQPENERGTVTVDFDENKTSSDAISLKLSEMGYPLVGKNNFGKKAKSYVSCMIGRVTAE